MAALLSAVGLLLAGATPAAAVDAVDVQHTVLHYETGKHTGIGALHAAQQWHWGDEFLTAYKESVWAPGSAGDPAQAPLLRAPGPQP